MKEKRPKIRQLIRQKISEVDPDAEVILYGSRAHGSYTKSSDWDVLILTKKPSVTNEIEDSFRDSLYDIELMTGQIISIQIYSKDYWNSRMIHSPLYYNIAKEGIKL